MVLHYMLLLRRSTYVLTAVRVLRPAVAPALPCRLAALEACCASTLTGLELEGAVPLSGDVAGAVATRCPHLSDLILDYRKLSRPSDAVPATGAASKYDVGCSQLLTLCGPRLRVLLLLGVHHWKAASYMALRRCTALKGLALDAGVEENTCGCEQYLGGCTGLLSRRLAGHDERQRLHQPVVYT